MPRRRRNRSREKTHGLPLQEVIFALSRFWAARGCVIQQPYDLEVGAGTMHPETFLRVLGPDPCQVAYVQPSRRPVDGRYGENPNRLYKHLQFQVILKPVPDDVQEVYLGSLAALGVELRQHDIRFEEDNWEAPTLGAWGMGWQVMLDGVEITQFTYFQQCGGRDLDPAAVELTYGLERIGLYLQNISNVFELAWNERMSYGQLRLEEERQFSAYSFDFADVATCRKIFELQEEEARRLLSAYPKDAGLEEKQRFPLLAVYDLCLKCSHLFNLLDSRGAISTTERAALIGRIRALTCQVASLYLDQRAAREQSA